MNIVVAYDGSEPARRALDRAAALASQGASVTVVSAVSVQHPAAIGRTAGPVDPDELQERNRELAEAERLLAERGVHAKAIEVVGDPPDAIVEAAKEAGADLIIVGTRGQSLAKRLMLGSVSTGIVHHAHCDVLVVR